MKRRLLQILLPVSIGLITVCVIFNMVISAARANYEAAARREVAELIGTLLENNPNLDQSELLHAIQGANQDTDNTKRLQLGESFLYNYGYLPNELVSSSTKIFRDQVFASVFIILVGFAISVILYFWVIDRVRQKHIEKLVSYLQDLNDHIYDLRLDENSEDELSLLTNELYKITVTLKEAAEQNHTKRQNLEDALADISHQLRTPLTSLQVMVDNIYDDPDMPQDVRQDFLQSIGRQLETMSSLVTTLLNLAKFDNGSIKLHNQPTAIGESLRDVRQNLAVLAELYGVDIEITGDLQAEIEFDRRWQTEALTNIVKNCIEHSSYGGTVRIIVEDCPLFLRVIISDHGEGIAPTDLRHIFERFYKAKNSTSSGVGIGLAFAKTIIESSNGQVSVSSQLSKGTKFTIIYFK